MADCFKHPEDFTSMWVYWRSLQKCTVDWELNIRIWSLCSRRRKGSKSYLNIPGYGSIKWKCSNTLHWTWTQMITPTRAPLHRCHKENRCCSLLIQEAPVKTEFIILPSTFTQSPFLGCPLNIGMQSWSRKAQFQGSSGILLNQNNRLIAGWAVALSRPWSSAIMSSHLSIVCQSLKKKKRKWFVLFSVQ